MLHCYNQRKTLAAVIAAGALDESAYVHRLHHALGAFGRAGSSSATLPISTPPVFKHHRTPPVFKHHLIVRLGRSARSRSASRAEHPRQSRRPRASLEAVISQRTCAQGLFIKTVSYL